MDELLKEIDEQLRVMTIQERKNFVLDLYEAEFVDKEVFREKLGIDEELYQAEIDYEIDIEYNVDLENKFYQIGAHKLREMIDAFYKDMED